MSEVRLIDANALKKQFEEVYPLSTNEMGCIINKGIYEIIDNAPTLPNPCGNPCNFIRPTGKWIEHYDPEDGFSWLTCSRCMAKAYEEDYKYCPQCGAKMDDDGGRE